MTKVVFVLFKANFFAQSSRGSATANEVQRSYLRVAIWNGISMTGERKVVEKHPRKGSAYLDGRKSPPTHC